MIVNELYEQARAGDKSAEAELFKKLADRFRVYAHRRIWDKKEADDIAENALATVLAEYRRIEFSTSFSAWAHKVLENRFLAYIQARRRQGGREIQLGNADCLTDNWTPDPTLKMRLLNCLKLVGQSNRRYARILNLHYLGFERDEVCAKLGITKTQSYLLMSRARAVLKDCLEKGELSR